MMNDTKVEQFHQSNDPFNDNQRLRNISTGVTADRAVNVDDAAEVGIKILRAMAGENVLDHEMGKKRHKQ